MSVPGFDDVIATIATGAGRNGAVQYRNEPKNFNRSYRLYIQVTTFT
jgi:hypothetical protein